jgi:cysteine desulfurase
MIYAEYNGSSPLLSSVREYLKIRLDSELFANPNAIHSLGQKISRGMIKSRQLIADLIGCHPDQVIFNSGSSEGISQIFHSILEKADQSKNIILTSPIEHSVIPNALSYYERHKGFKIIYVDIDQEGRVLVSHLEKLLNEYKNKVAMVTIMAVNNETGVYQPYQKISDLCHEEGVEYFCDTTQLIGKGDFHFESSGLDYAVCSGHKLGALTGSGFLIAKDPTKLLPLVFGSTQEKGLRGGTQHYLGIETLAVALNDFNQNKEKLSKLCDSKLAFEALIKKDFPEVKIIGDGAARLSGTTLIGYPGIHGQAVQIELESHDIFVTTSAACLDNQPETSKVLKAMGVQDDIGRGVIRISLSYSQGEKEYSTIAKVLKAAYTKLGKIKSY